MHKMKNNLILSLSILSCNAFAYDYPDEHGKCWILDGRSIIQKCLIVSGGGAGGTFTQFVVNKKDYYIEESNFCDEEVNCHILVGNSYENSKEARSYYRSIKNNKIIPKWEHGAWNCYQQIRGKMHICYSTPISPPKNQS
ncbi:hypothetical protein KXJ74_07005 [Acinetobacter johnsonii]|nr:hypothetical protein KXJ74_07005 [Acinetobacter johnsonii]